MMAVATRGVGHRKRERLVFGFVVLFAGLVAEARNGIVWVYPSYTCSNE